MEETSLVSVPVFENSNDHDNRSKRLILERQIRTRLHVTNKTRAKTASQISCSLPTTTTLS